MATELTTFSVGTSILNPCKPFMDLWYKVNHQLPNYRLHVVPFEDDHSDILSEISALVTIPVDWDFSAPYGILYQLQPGNDIEKFVNAIKNSVDAE